MRIYLTYVTRLETKSQSRKEGGWKFDISALRGSMGPDLDMANIFSRQLERGRTARPPYTPYVTTDFLATPPDGVRLGPLISEGGRVSRAKFTLPKTSGRCRTAG